MKNPRRNRFVTLLTVGLSLSLALLVTSYNNNKGINGKINPQSQLNTELATTAQQPIQARDSLTAKSNQTTLVLGKPISHSLESWYGGDLLSARSRLALREQLDATIAQLQTEQILPAVFSDVAVKFDLPIQATENTEGFAYHTISNYLDHSSVVGALQDYRCGDRTYDATDGYNHTGTDFMPFPFPWQKMDRNEVEVIAAADGVIIAKEDGRYDLECTPESRQANMFILQHEDGTQSWYLHLKNGSLSDKEIGDSVKTGEYLGTIGSSGRSSGPHLHFEVQDADGNVIDPFYSSTHATCNPDIQESLWVEQPTYTNATINDLITSAVAPEFPSCQKALLPKQTVFAGGDELYINAFFRDNSNALETNFSIIDPSGSVALTWSHRADTPHAASSAWSFPITLPPNVELGDWEIEAAFNDGTYVRKVSFAASVPATATPTATFTPVPTVAAAASTPVPTSTPTATPTETPTPVTPQATPATATTPVPSQAQNNTVYLPAVTN